MESRVNTKGQTVVLVPCDALTALRGSGRGTGLGRRLLAARRADSSAPIT